MPYLVGRGSWDCFRVGIDTFLMCRQRVDFQAFTSELPFRDGHDFLRTAVKLLEILGR